MKAALVNKFGEPDVIRVIEKEKSSPLENEVLVKVHAASVNFNNLVLISGKPFLARLMGIGLLKPRYSIPGNDIAGQVEAVGRKIVQFKPGDEVYGDLARCGFGAFAEYVCVPESAIALKPANIDFTEAAAVPEAAVVALHALRDKGKIKAGHKVLIYGASGGIGTFAVQIAKYFGAEVTGVCSSGNLDLVRSIGADQVIDYTKEDFTKNGRKYDLIVATAGYRSIFDYKRALSPKGIYVATGGSMKGPKAMAQIFEPLLLGPWISMFSSKKLYALTLKINKQDLVLMKEIIESGKVKPVIDRSYPLTEITEALRYYAEGHARGKVVVIM